MKNGGNGRARRNGKLFPEELKRDVKRYWENAKEHLGKAGINPIGPIYNDRKEVMEACGVCWIATLTAIKAYLLEQGVSSKSLPEDKPAYSAMLKKYSHHNGKLVNFFEDIYEIIHLDGYYRNERSVNYIKAGFQKAKKLIETLTGEKVE